MIWGPNAVRGGNGKYFTYRVYAKGLADAHECHYDDNNYDAWHSAQTRFRMEWAEDKRGDFTLQGDGYVESVGEDAGATSYTPPYSQTLYGREYLCGGNILGRGARTCSEGNDIQVQAFVDRTNHREVNLADYRPTYDVNYLQRPKHSSRQQFSFGLGARAITIYDRIIVSGLTFTFHQPHRPIVHRLFQYEIALISSV